VKTDYLYDPRVAVALMRRDELLAEAARARLVAEARAGANRPQPGRLDRAYVVIALVVALLVAGFTLPYLAGASAGQKTREMMVRHAPLATPAATPVDPREDGTR
jgi:hypothetical protein